MPQSDAVLRPFLAFDQAASYPQQHLPAVIARLARLHSQLPILRSGDYQQLHVSSSQFAFLRGEPAGQVVTAVNMLPEPALIDLLLPFEDGFLVDLLNPGWKFPVQGGRARVALDPAWGRVMVFEITSGGSL